MDKERHNCAGPYDGTPPVSANHRPLAAMLPRLRDRLMILPRNN